MPITNTIELVVHKDSSVCKSALHDFRISSWNSSARTVDIVFKDYEKYNFSASLRNGVLSKRPTSVTDVNDTSAIVSWDSTQDVDSYAANYWIQYRKLNEPWEKVVVVAVPKAPKYTRTLTGLRSGSAYEVRVLVIDSDGKFQETGSLTTKFRTLCGRPTSPPTNVKIDNSSATSVLITWEVPKSKDPQATATRLDRSSSARCHSGRELSRAASQEVVVGLGTGMTPTPTGEGHAQVQR
ncbi:hypothetical protein HPB47_018522 [Ixodes persulcatus]|uniref:Uncharacterized protein n=1 Tax=Ixodes persulcatus TaxID=34615 RepID=A0AC60QLC4_IXOPE|nr:hypothetical protein HPB47_018522 [Ixodes persulcatus]